MKRGAADSTFLYILEALLPFTDANTKLIYKPHLFFRDLERISHYKKRSIQNAFYKLKKRGLIEVEGGTPRLTRKGFASLRIYKPEKLESAYLMVIFDIPESDRRKRQQLRTLLRELRFQQVQKSVWMTHYECRDYLRAEIQELQLEGCVRVLEAYELP